MSEEELAAYEEDEDNFTQEKFDDMGTPGSGWHMPFVTGHRYKVSWGASGLDFETIQVKVEYNWEDGDSPIEIVHNHTDTRVYVNATTYDHNWSNSEQVENGTYTDS